jgi:chaperonin cofactor prefoldin
VGHRTTLHDEPIVAELVPECPVNAEEALKAAHGEIGRQRVRIGELTGQVRDLEAQWTQEAIQRITTDNTTLKQRVRQLTQDNRTLEERLNAARSKLRFQDCRLADLQARLQARLAPSHPLPVEMAMLPACADDCARHCRRAEANDRCPRDEVGAIRSAATVRVPASDRRLPVSTASRVMAGRG